MYYDSKRDCKMSQNPSHLMLLVGVMSSRIVTSEVVGQVMGSSRMCSTGDSLRFFLDRDDAPWLAL